MPLKSYRDLIAWQKAMDLVQTVYESVRAFPKEEIYGLTSQLKRAVVSVASNIAEGQGRKSTGEFLHHLSIAYGSLMEVETQILIGARLKYLSQQDAEQIAMRTAEVGRLINGLSSSLINKQGEAVGR
ncbi:MAG TPA: four helix bundle protein [Pyrinomonadaceae bacterium]|nr:four helix bundle protein [Pyrinomonadaceae bacterium]